jgi:hypothetical protein
MGMVDKALNFCFPDLNVRNGELGDFNERTFALYVQLLIHVRTNYFALTHSPHTVQSLMVTAIARMVCVAACSASSVIVPPTRIVSSRMAVLCLPCAS